MQLAQTKRSPLLKTDRGQKLASQPNLQQELPIASQQPGRNLHSNDHNQAATLAAFASGDDVASAASDDRAYWHRVAMIGMQLANALEFAHSQGVLHRDLKPANILLDLQGHVWLTDFGLAQITDDVSLTRSGDIVGTLRYLAPERLKGECSRQSDVYGLGVTLYELITFIPAFPETDRARLIQQIAHQSPKRPRLVNRQIPRDLETIILKACEKELAHRYANAAELADDLSRFLSDRPIRARRVVLAEQLWRGCRRNPTVTTLIAIVGLLLFGLSFAWGMFSWVQADRNRARAAERTAQQSQMTASRAEALAQSQSHFAQAVGYRHSSRSGSKAKSLDEIRRAMEFNPPHDIQFLLRNEAIATLSKTDLSFERLLRVKSDKTERVINFDREFKSFSALDPTGLMTIRNYSDNQELGRLPVNVLRDTNVKLSADGKRLFEHTAGTPGTLTVREVTTGEICLGPLSLDKG